MVEKGQWAFRRILELFSRFEQLSFSFAVFRGLQLDYFVLG